MQILYKKEIILATDFSDASKEACYYALQLAQSFKIKQLKALHVFDTSAWNVSPSYYMYMKPAKQKFGRIIEETKRVPKGEKNFLKGLAKSFSLKIEMVFIEGNAGEEIVHYAEERNAGLLILGTHGYTGWKRFILGSVAEFVVRYAPCSVLTIRHTKKWIKPMPQDCGDNTLKERSVEHRQDQNTESTHVL